MGSAASMAHVGFAVGVAVDGTTAKVGIAFDVAVGVITELVYSILHGQKSCNIEYGQWLALQLVKLEIDRGWHWG